MNIIIYFYGHQSVHVKFKSSFSNSWNSGNGVRQGAILSPILFCVYVDDLISDLSRSKLGVKQGLDYSNIISYADDMVLLSPSVAALQRLLNMFSQKLACLNLYLKLDKSVIVNFSLKIQNMI